ncbi:MAG: hypothetical protein WDN47_04285 [Candidatus Doudnabacteria bacterium]
MSHKTDQMTTLTPLALEIAKAIKQSLAGKTILEDKIVFTARHTRRGLVVQHNVIVNRQFDTRLTKEDWRKIFSIKWKPRKLLVLKKLRETDNKPISTWSIPELVEETPLGYDSSKGYDIFFIRKGLPFRMRKLKGCLQLAQEL